jgi:hypothetical protein
MPVKVDKAEKDTSFVVEVAPHQPTTSTITSNNRIHMTIRTTLCR